MAALRWATLLGCGGTALRYTLLNVQKPIMSGEVGAIAPATIVQDERDHSAADILEQAAAIVRASGIPVEVEEQMDDAASAIIARAEALGCDAIVVGRRGLGVVRAALLGSVSTEVVRRSRIPVIIVSAATTETSALPLRMMLAVDNSESATRATTFAANLASLCKLDVHLLNVEPGMTVAGAVFGRREKIIEHWSGKQAHEALAGTRDMLDQAGVKYNEHVASGNETHSAILHAARQGGCNIIVMGTRGLGPISGVLLGSVTRKLLEEAPASVSAVVLVH